jgi:CO/xanthine dehydrogenase Mo-binding subunit
MDYRPWTWKLPENYKETQPKIVRQDAHEKVSGKAVYTRDIHLPGMLYAKIYTSPYAHSKNKEHRYEQGGSASGRRDILKYSDPDIAHDSGIGAWCMKRRANYDILTSSGHQAITTVIRWASPWSPTARKSATKPCG